MDQPAVLPPEAPIPMDPLVRHELRDLLRSYLQDTLVALGLKRRGLAEFLLNRAAEIQSDHLDIDLGRRKCQAIKASPNKVMALSGSGQRTELPENFAILSDDGQYYTVEYFEATGQGIDPSWINPGA